MILYDPVLKDTAGLALLNSVRAQIIVPCDRNFATNVGSLGKKVLMLSTGKFPVGVTKSF